LKHTIDNHKQKSFLRKRAVVTLSIGTFTQEMSIVTHPSLKKYAERNDADFIVMDRPLYVDKLKLLLYEKFQVGELLDGRYDQILFIDTDVLIAPDAPSVFEICPVDTFGFSSEESYSMSGPHKKITQEKLGEISWTAPYFNTGVMIFSPVHKEIFNPKSKILEKWAFDESHNDHTLGDQPLLNYLANYYKFKFLDLGFKFNHTSVIKNTKIRFRSYIIHYSSSSGHRYGPKLYQIKKDAGVFKSPLNLFLSRKILFYRWVMDRCDLYFIRYVLDKLFKTNFYK
jgi:hypothetical protein